MADSGAPVLELSDVEMRFGGVTVLTGLSIDVAEGEVFGLIGPNGAGKSTLFNIASGLLTPVSGRVVLDGRDITKMRPDARARRGLARTFQRLETFRVLTVRENVLVAAEIRRRWSRDRTSPKAIADDLLERVGLSDIADKVVDTLSTGSARLVEVARALATKPRVLLLDEPASGLDDQETSRLGALLRGLAADGLSVVLVEHDVSLVMDVCARVAVLDNGRILTVGAPDAVRGDDAVQAAYLGPTLVET
jgi:branched-chain amino acid transport system ATP-binding protein